MAKPRLTYVGHSYHEKTGSTLFLQDLLSTAFDVTTMWDESWRSGAPPLTARAINATRPDHVVLFQRQLRRAEYAQIECSNVTWIPMHDSVGYGPHWLGWRRSGMKLLCFSAMDRDYFASLGFETLHVRYAPKPLPEPERSVEAGLVVFFWLRHERIGWDTLKRLLGPQRPAKIVLRVAPDPGHCPVVPSAEEVREYGIELHEGWMEGEQYRRLLRGCSVFMAPRPSEGIGQALLDARALGLAAVAPDAPTMNEYLRHGVTGYLYDPASPRPLDFSALKKVREHSVADLAVAQEAWRVAEPKLLEFVRKPAPGQPLWWRLRSRLSRN